MAEASRAEQPDGWERHRKEQAESIRRLTPAERLAWLEEAIEFAYRSGALPRRSDQATREPEEGAGSRTNDRDEPRPVEIPRT